MIASPRSLSHVFGRVAQGCEQSRRHIRFRLDEILVADDDEALEIADIAAAGENVHLVLAGNLHRLGRPWLPGEEGLDVAADQRRNKLRRRYADDIEAAFRNFELLGNQRPQIIGRAAADRADLLSLEIGEAN